jgi:hypothetical protein
MTRRECLALIPGTAAGSVSLPPLKGALLSNAAWPRATTLREWTSDVMRISGTEGASETAQGKAFFEWLRLFSRMAVGGMIQAYEGPSGKEQYVLDAHKNLFVYGWGYCDTTSRIAEAAWQEYRQDPRSAERVVVQHDDGGYHTMFRLRMDGRHGAFDPRYGYYLIERDAPDARILDWAELGRDGNFQRNRGYRHRCRPFFEISGIEWQRALLLHPAYFDTEDAWRAAGAPKEHVFGNGQYVLGTPLHDMQFSLPRGSVLTRFWDNSARKFYVPAGRHTKRERPFLRSGRFYRVTETSHNRNWPEYDPNYERAKSHLFTVPRDEDYPPEVAGGRTIGQAYGVIDLTARVENEVFDFRCPYIIVDGTISSTPPTGVTSLQIRTLTAKPRNAGEPDSWSPWQPLDAASARLGVHGVYRFQLRTTSPSPVALSLKLYFENGIMTIPPLFSGENHLRFHLSNPAELSGVLTITYEYETAQGSRTFRGRLTRADFRGNHADFTADTQGLTRCRSVSISC